MQLVARDSTLDLSCPHIMGILNVTPDSFSDGGKHNKLDAALLHVQEMVNAGATLIDIGGESTRPGAAEVSTEEELNRVVPVVEAIAKRFDVWISVDTSKPEVMTASAQAGAHLINDIRALQEPGALKAAAATGLPVCLMHMQGMPRTMQHKPHYDDLMQDIGDFLQQQIDRCVSANIPKSKLLLDPGFGFGKNLAHNYALLARLSELHRFELPLLVGMSRKSMIGQILNVPPAQRVHGSIACAVIAAMQGAQIIRVHDVKETADAMRIVEATLSAKE
ncbi:dihydropteroate synthase [Pectobacterium brasiliense]|uniref:dihydropteroate synthase n=1 Tax=Pectobacterium brasiliense TaxID=180957 RepID=UPI00057CB24F|nr:dihydropteroate synthase [Pectobacterium brasiliense]APS28713.1 dihydropteroate synthase [Pectobacterium brasiliense]KHT04273.1 dihydropteroate synthase [Pectobacterium brasiliense]MBN3097759.1 dihydropteroate synthase [Pectobacterium brasiliense]MBN3102996.1 dihydropteroate synthase [Pectobacterium brasiliense]MBN3164186.1 dihydropteroate synthase [Pectobacterium brasiliense]